MGKQTTTATYNNWYITQNVVKKQQQQQQSCTDCQEEGSTRLTFVALKKIDGLPIFCSKNLSGTDRQYEVRSASEHLLYAVLSVVLLFYGYHIRKRKKKGSGSWGMVVEIFLTGRSTWGMG